MGRPKARARAAAAVSHGRKRKDKEAPRAEHAPQRKRSRGDELAADDGLRAALGKSGIGSPADQLAVAAAVSKRLEAAKAAADKTKSPLDWGATARALHREYHKKYFKAESMGRLLKARLPSRTSFPKSLDKRIDTLWGWSALPLFTPAQVDAELVPRIEVLEESEASDPSSDSDEDDRAVAAAQAHPDDDGGDDDVSTGPGVLVSPPPRGVPWATAASCCRLRERQFCFLFINDSVGLLLRS